MPNWIQHNNECKFCRTTQKYGWCDRRNYNAKQKEPDAIWFQLDEVQKQKNKQASKQTN